MAMQRGSLLTLDVSPDRRGVLSWQSTKEDHLSRWKNFDKSGTIGLKKDSELFERDVSDVGSDSVINFVESGSESTT